MKSIAKAILVVGFMVAAQAAVAAGVSGDFPLGADQIRANAEPAVHDTYRAEHAGNQSTVSGDFPLGDMAIVAKSEPPVRNTYQSEHAGTRSAY